MIVYKITNKINGKVYIGQTVKPLERRFKQHCQKRNRCVYIGRAIQKYGKENFEYKVLAYCNNFDEMDHREQYYIKLFNSLTPNGYNLTTGGHKENRHATVNRKPITEEKRKELSEKYSGAGNPRYGVKADLSTRMKISAKAKGRPGCKHTMLGKKHTEETKRKMAEASRGRRHNLGKKHDDKFKQACRERVTLRNYKKVINIETGEIVNSAKELAVMLNLKYSSLVNWLNGTNPSQVPSWKYLQDTDKKD